MGFLQQSDHKFRSKFNQYPRQTLVMPQMDNHITLRDVSHAYGKRLALHPTDLTFSVGVTGLLGPNGAGKSTLLKLIATAIPLIHGCITYPSGITLSRATLHQVRQLIGYLPQRFDLMPWATVRSNVEYAAWAQGVPAAKQPAAVDRALALVGLTSRKDSSARSLSGGMRQRLGLACALVHEPEVLILDEPTVGLDPAQRRDIRRAIHEIAQHCVVILSTHLVEDLATIAQTVVIMRDGNICFCGPITELGDIGAPNSNEHASAFEAGYHTILDRAEHPA